jgi:purine-binding chemotaxis protein CheW
VKGDRVGRRFVSFGIGGSRWCLPVASVVQIVRNENVHDLPHARPPVAGVVTLHNDVVPVVDLRERLAVESPADSAAGAKKRRILVVRLDGRPYGILVDEVRELVDLEEGRDDDTRTPLPACAAGRAFRGDEMLPILDIARAMGTGG